MKPEDVDTTNDCFVGVQGDSIVFLRSPNKLSKQRALVLAAWIVCLADDNDDFGTVLEAVQS